MKSSVLIPICSVLPLCSPCLGGEYLLNGLFTTEDTDNTEESQRISNQDTTRWSRTRQLA